MLECGAASKRLPVAVVRRQRRGAERVEARFRERDSRREQFSIKILYCRSEIASRGYGPRRELMGSFHGWAGSFPLRPRTVHGPRHVEGCFYFLHKLGALKLAI